MKVNKNKKISQVLLVCYFLLLKFSFCFKCGHNENHKRRHLSKQYYHDDQVTYESFLKTEFQSIRISVDYYNLETKKVDQNWLTNVKSLMDNTLNLLIRTVKVKRLKNPIKSSDCIIDEKFKVSSLVKDGIATDLLLFTDVIEDKSNVEAWASSCQYDKRSKRPVAGVIVFSSTYMKFDKENWLEYYTYLVLHEIIHVLGMDLRLFDTFYDLPSDSAKPLETILKNNVMTNGILRSLIISTKVVEAAKNHFNCIDLEGVELENQGDIGTAGSHWESRIMLGDIMIGISYEEVFLSTITCAFLEDTGWYQINCYNGGLFKFGLNKGCKFVKEPCIKNEKVVFENQFCNINGQKLCSVGDKSKGYCLILNKEDNKEFQNELNYKYFMDEKLGGFELSDFCPVVNGINSETKFFQENCSIGIADPLNGTLENISSESGCFMSTLSKQGNKIFLEGNKHLPICLKYKCNSENTTVDIYLEGNEFLQCPGGGGNLKVEGFDGDIICPEYNEYCTGSIPCNSMIDCINKKSFNKKNEDLIFSVNSLLVNKEEKAKLTVEKKKSSELEEEENLSQLKISFSSWLLFLMIFN